MLRVKVFDSRPRPGGEDTLVGTAFLVHPFMIFSTKQTSQPVLQQRLFHSAPAPTLPLHIPCFSMVFLLLLLLLSLVFMCSQSHSAAPFYLLPIPFLSFASLLGWPTLCDHGKTPLQGLQCRIFHRTGYWLLSYRTTPLQFVKDF